jgi:hypothetical protein
MDDTAKEIIEVPFKKPPDNAQEIVIIDLNTFFTEAGHIARSPHRIKFYQILFITRGEGTHWVDLEPFPYCQGTLFPIEKGQVQVYDLNPETEGYLILFTEQYLYRYSTDLEWLFNLVLFNRCFSPPVLHLPLRDYDEFLSLIKYMKAELTSNPDFARDDILRNLLRVFILKLKPESFLRKISTNFWKPSNLSIKNPRGSFLTKQFKQLLEAATDNRVSPARRGEACLASTKITQLQVVALMLARRTVLDSGRPTCQTVTWVSMTSSPRARATEMR